MSKEKEAKLVSGCLGAIIYVSIDERVGKGARGCERESGKGTGGRMILWKPHQMPQKKIRGSSIEAIESQ